jgi:hypothetical protein
VRRRSGVAPEAIVVEPVTEVDTSVAVQTTADVPAEQPPSHPVTIACGVDERPSSVNSVSRVNGQRHGDNGKEASSSVPRA